MTITQPESVFSCFKKQLRWVLAEGYVGMNSSKGSTLHIKALGAGGCVRLCVCLWLSGCVLPLNLQDAVDEIVKDRSIKKLPVKNVRHRCTHLFSNASHSNPSFSSFQCYKTFLIIRVDHTAHKQ